MPDAEGDDLLPECCSLQFSVPCSRCSVLNSGECHLPFRLGTLCVSVWNVVISRPGGLLLSCGVGTVEVVKAKGHATDGTTALELAERHSGTATNLLPLDCPLGF